MSKGLPSPVLNRLYQHYLSTEDTAAFIKAVAERYTTATLERLALGGNRVTRRAALLALGFLGTYESNQVLGRAMHDRDRGARVLAENGIREVWMRDGNESQRQRLNVISRLIASGQFDEAADEATDLIEEAPWIAESWNQRAIAYFHLARYREAANDCHQTLELNPYHFGAAIGMAQCYIEMRDPPAALQCYRRALKLNPSLEGVRAQVEYLQRTMEGT